MRKVTICATLIMLHLLVCSSCQSLQQVSIEYLRPAMLSFPSQIRKVAIVDNTSCATNKTLTYKADKLKAQSGIVSQASTTTYADGHRACEALATEIAQHNYFDAVIICDSALQEKKQVITDHTLPQNEVIQLTSALNVDMLIALEFLPLKLTKSICYLPDADFFQGVMDVEASPILQLYIPGRNKPINALNPTDSIYWYAFGNTPEEAYHHLIQDTTALAESAAFTGALCAKLLVPTWNKDVRYLYNSGSVALRDAAIYAREDSWEEAFELWKLTFEKNKSKKRKMKAAFNLAVYYEMKDDLSTAQEWAQKAVALAKEMDQKNIVSRVQATMEDVPHYYLANRYWKQLKERNEQITKLKIQMSRFHDDF